MLIEALIAASEASDPLKDDLFEGVDPGIIVPLLGALKTVDCINGRPFFKTYGKWSGLTSDQKGKVVQFWRTNLSEQTRKTLLEVARKKIIEDVNEEKERQAITTKHDKARILHLRVDPNAAGDWTEAMREKTRLALDTDMPDADPWNRLAEKFNNYEAYNYTNAVIKQNVQSPSGLYVAVTGMEAIATDCFDINPCMPGRPLRDGGWLRIQFRELKGKISQCFTNYNKSGNQEEENQYDSWTKFSKAFNNDVVTYSRAILSDSDMNQLGRALPIGVQRDTSTVDKDDTYESRKELYQAKKKQRRESKEARRLLCTPDNNNKEFLDGSENKMSSKYSSLAETIETGIAAANHIAKTQAAEATKLSALKLILEFGDPEDKAKALAELRQLAS